MARTKNPSKYEPNKPENGKTRFFSTNIPESTQEDEETSNNESEQDVEENTEEGVSDENEVEVANEEQPMQPLEFFFTSTEFAKSTKMQTRCDPYKVIEVLKTRLTAEELRWFTEHQQFKHIFHMLCHRTRKVMGMWMLLLHTARIKKRRQCWFVVNGVPIRYSIREHALLSGLCCHHYPKEHQKIGSLAFARKYFGEKHKVPKVEVKDVLEALENMGNVETDRLKMAVLYFLCTVIRGRKKMYGGNIEEFILRIVDDLDVCETFPWGRFTFDDCLHSISDMMDLMGGTVRETSTFPGFILPFEILAFECIPTLNEKFRENLEDTESDCPRMCKARFKETSTTGFSLNQIYDVLGSTKDIYSILAPQGEEEELVDNLVEDGDDEMDHMDIIVDGWINVLTKPGGKIWWENLYNFDIQSRLQQPPVLKPLQPTIEPSNVSESNYPTELEEKPQ